MFQFVSLIFQEGWFFPTIIFNSPDVFYAYEHGHGQNFFSYIETLCVVVKEDY